MKKEFSEAQKLAVKKNLEKARAARARKKAAKEAKLVVGVDLTDVEESYRKLLTTMAERDYIPGHINLCPCQDAWKSLEKLEKLNGDRKRGEAGSTNVDQGFSEAVLG
jgi:hypothetical protein